MKIHERKLEGPKPDPCWLSIHYGTVMVLLLVAVAVMPAHGQSTCQRSWIFFSGKDPQATRVGSTEAQERRRLRGSTGAHGLSLPVSRRFIDALQEAGVTVRHTSRWLNAASGCVPDEAKEQVLELPFVRDVMPVGRLGTVSSPPLVEHTAPTERSLLDAGDIRPFDKDTLLYGAALRQLELINAVDPLERGYNGQGVTIGFLDTRFDFSHPTFAHFERDGRPVVTKDFISDTDTTNYHGLSVSSVALGYEEGAHAGPCWGASAVYAATTEVTAFERNVEEDYFVAGLEWLEEQGVDIVNVSLGYDRFDDGEQSYELADLDGDHMIPTIAADAAAALGVTVVAAAGNQGGCGSHTSSCWYYVGSPADGDSVIAVGGVSPDSVRWYRSSPGPTYDGRIKPDVMALSSTVSHARSGGSYATGNGTSFAAPLVSGVVCQMLQANPALGPREVWEMLTQTASQASEPDTLMGWGIVNAAAAVNTALGIDTGTSHPIVETPTFEWDPLESTCRHASLSIL